MFSCWFTVFGRRCAVGRSVGQCGRRSFIPCIGASLNEATVKREIIARETFAPDSSERCPRGFTERGFTEQTSELPSKIRRPSIFML